nr:hypothetical protein [Tanacetum cinerariifolium]
METSMEIVYAPKVKACLIVGAVQFLNNNVVGYFNYPMNVPTYKYLGNKQPADMGLLSNPNDGIHQSKSFPEGKPTDPQDIERNKHLAITGLPATNPNEGLKELSNEEVYEAKDEMKEAFPLNTKLQSQPPLSTKKVAEDNWAKHEEAVASYADLK